MPTKNQHIVNAQAEINMCVFILNLNEKELQKMAEYGSSINNKKSAEEHKRYHAEKAIKELTEYLNKTKV